MSSFRAPFIPILASDFVSSQKWTVLRDETEHSLYAFSSKDHPLWAMTILFDFDFKSFLDELKSKWLREMILNQPQKCFDLIHSQLGQKNLTHMWWLISKKEIAAKWLWNILIELSRHLLKETGSFFYYLQPFSP